MKTIKSYIQFLENKKENELDNSIPIEIDEETEKNEDETDKNEKED